MLATSRRRSSAVMVSGSRIEIMAGSQGRTRCRLLWLSMPLAQPAPTFVNHMMRVIVGRHTTGLPVGTDLVGLHGTLTFGLPDTATSTAGIDGERTMAGTWLYSISKRPGYHFIIDGKKIPVTIDSYRDLIESGQLDRDRDWHLTQHWDHIEVGDQVFIYTGDEDVGILGFATVARVNLAQQTMDLSFDIEKCKMLLRSPVPASKVRRWKLNLRKNVVDLNSVATRLHKLLPWARPVPSDIPRTVQAGPPSDAAGHTGSNPAPVNTGSGIPKLLVLKPIMWNDQGYQRPAGCPSTSGYSHEHGFGHEEWNNNPNWFWQGWKVFHTEASQKLRDAAENGNLGMLMVASRGGKAMALGVATNVYINNETDMAAIAQAVGQDKDWPAVWDLRTVRTQYPNREHFLQQCQVAKAWIRWRCLPSNYYWFPKPVVLDPMRLTGKKRLAMHHGRFTEITAAVMLDIIDGHLPGDRSAIREWLTCGEFSQIERKGTLSQSRGEKIMAGCSAGEMPQLIAGLNTGLRATGPLNRCTIGCRSCLWIT